MGITVPGIHLNVLGFAYHWVRRIAHFVTLTIYSILLAVMFIGLLVLFGDHDRSHVPPGVLTVSVLALASVLVLIHAVTVWAHLSTFSVNVLIQKPLFDIILVFGSAAVLYGGSDLILSYGDGSGLQYFAPGVAAILFWWLWSRPPK